MIVVTGMHRSGTSLVCQLLASMGVSFGPVADRFPTDRWNPAGYFEQKAVMDCNSRIVTGLPRNRARVLAWCSKLIYLGMPGGAAIARRGDRAHAAIVALGEQYGACAVKDPRFCVTLGAWLPRADVRHVVVCLRAPAAVVASVRRRDRVPRWLATRFCAWHLRELAALLPRDRSVFVDVDRLAAGAVDEVLHLQRRLGLAGPADANTLLREIVRPDGLSGAADGTCPAAIAGAWRQLQELRAAEVAR